MEKEKKMTLEPVLLVKFQTAVTKNKYKQFLTATKNFPTPINIQYKRISVLREVK